MIKLSNRLAKIASFVDKEDKAIDIGCDHALLDIFLAKKYKNKYIASDLRNSALEMAKSNIEKYDAKKEVILRQGNGLEAIKPEDNIDTVIISGMGFQTIINILKDVKSNKNIKKLVIQTNSYPEKVRKFLLNNNYHIEKEEVVLDKNFYYIVSLYKRGEKEYKKIDLEIGFLDSSDISKKYIENEIKKYNILYKLVPLLHIKRRYQIRKKLKLLNSKRNSI